MLIFVIIEYVIVKALKKKPVVWTKENSSEPAFSINRHLIFQIWIFSHKNSDWNQLEDKTKDSVFTNKQRESSLLSSRRAHTMHSLDSLLSWVPTDRPSW